MIAPYHLGQELTIVEAKLKEYQNLNHIRSVRVKD